MIESILQKPVPLTLFDVSVLFALVWFCVIALTQSFRRILILCVSSLAIALLLIYVKQASWMWLVLLPWFWVSVSDISWKAFDKALYEIVLRSFLAFALLVMIGVLILIRLEEGILKESWFNSVFGFYWMSLVDWLNSILAF